MLIFKLKEFNTEIDNYNDFIANIEVKTITCPNCDSLDMERHGYYKRYINISGKRYYIRILRVRCKVCGHTHAVLPDFIIPYLHEPITNILEIILTPNTSDIDENLCKTINKIKKKWIPMLNSLMITFSYSLNELVSRCSYAFNMCVTQIHRGKYYYMS